MAGVCAALVLACFAIYGQTLSHDFVNYDDNLYVTDNPQVLAGLSWTNIKWAFTTDRAVHMHPIAWISHMIDCDLYGLRPWGHHLTSLIFHTLAAVLLFLVFARMTDRLWASALVAALFAVHPLHVESVAWIAERKDVLSMLFWTGSIGAYAWYVQRPGPVRYLAMAFLFLLGLMSKTMVATLPFVLLLLDYWPLDRMSLTASFGVTVRKAIRLALEKTPLFLMTALFCTITFMMQVDAKNLAFGEKVPFAARCANAVVVYVIYLTKTVWPSGLAVYYPHPITRPMWQVGGSAVILTAITLFCLLHTRRHPYLIVGWFWYLGTLVPVIELVQFASFSHADRYTYIPHIGIFIMVAWGAADLAARWHVPKRAVAAASGTVLVMLSACAGVQAGYWRDSETLFRHALAVGQESSTAFNNLGAVALEQKRYDDAKACLTKALDLDPDYVPTLNNLGKLAVDQGRYGEARPYLTKALDLDPDYVEALMNLGVLATNQRRFREAESYLTKTLELRPDSVEALNNMGKLALDIGRRDKAKAYLLRALELKPDSVEVLNNMGKLALDQGRYEEAKTFLTKALDLAPEEVNALNNLGLLALNQGHYDEAKACLEKALIQKPDNIQVLNNLGKLAVIQRRYAEARAFLTKALELDSTCVSALNNLGGCLAYQGQFEEAQGYFRKAVEIDPQFLDAMNNLGATLAKLGRPEEADVYLRRAVELNQSRTASKE